MFERAWPQSVCLFLYVCLFVRARACACVSAPMCRHVPVCVAQIQQWIGNFSERLVFFSFLDFIYLFLSECSFNDGQCEGCPRWALGGQSERALFRAFITPAPVFACTLISQGALRRFTHHKLPWHRRHFSSTLESLSCHRSWYLYEMGWVGGGIFFFPVYLSLPLLVLSSEGRGGDEKWASTAMWKGFPVPSYSVSHASFLMAHPALRCSALLC